MKQWTVLVFLLMFCVSCTECLGWRVPDPRCDEFYTEGSQICKDLGMWLKDKKCMTEWDRARNKCRDRTAPPRCRGFYDEAKQFCKKLTGNEFGVEEARCDKKLTEATHKCADTKKGFFQTLFGGRKNCKS